jgi:hypothetical protein
MFRKERVRTPDDVSAPSQAMAGSSMRNLAGVVRKAANGACLEAHVEARWREDQRGEQVWDPKG